ncbi:hypothetical protein QQS21_000378 [Conoideocrella luteorostrata]|uniref:Amidohydrolase-related domain-containing protein n=1 Tax=Conoideocrella luteorostrata TaxID=1105319 RepID=A0AAJ0D160_9HYPO|nr:hypothetical protein QQS21_000378 [Conoideocrella luteorostrata]
MLITRISGVNVLVGSEVQNESSLTFVCSPGDIISSNSAPDTLVDGTGCTVMPGLIDCRFGSDATDDAPLEHTTYGLTTVIDSSTSCAKSQAMRIVASDDPGLPSYIASGSAIGSDNDTLVSLFDRSAVQIVLTPDEAQTLVEAKIVSGQSDFIKIVVDQPGLEADIISRAVQETHRHGKLAIAYASQTKAYRVAVDLGFDHISPVPIDGEIEADVIDDIVRLGIGIIPALSYLEKAMPLWKRNAPNDDFSFAVAAVRALDAAGARLCAGSSANHLNTVPLPFGKGLHDEMRLLAKVGLSNAKIIRAATSEPATLFGLLDRGVVGSGLRADLILVEGNPLEDLEFLSKIRSVWIRGVPCTK